MSDSPKQFADNLNQMISAWQTLAPNATFGGMTLAQFKQKAQPSLDTRQSITNLESQMTALIDQRDNADNETSRLMTLVVNSVKGDPNYGDDSELYDAMGYVRKSERQSGLSRRKAAAATAGK